MFLIGKIQKILYLCNILFPLVPEEIQTDGFRFLE